MGESEQTVTCLQTLARCSVLSTAIVAVMLGFLIYDANRVERTGDPEELFHDGIFWDNMSGAYVRVDPRNITDKGNYVLESYVTSVGEKSPLNPPLHVHEKTGETFYISEGTMVFKEVLADGTVTTYKAYPGDTVVFEPPYTHTFWCDEGQDHCRFYCLVEQAKEGKSFTYTFFQNWSAYFRDCQDETGEYRPAVLQIMTFLTAQDARPADVPAVVWNALWWFCRVIGPYLGYQTEFPEYTGSVEEFVERFETPAAEEPSSMDSLHVSAFSYLSPEDY